MNTVHVRTENRQHTLHRGFNPIFFLFFSIFSFERVVSFFVKIIVESIKSKQSKSNQIKSNQIKSNQIESNRIKSNQIESNRIKRMKMLIERMKMFIERLKKFSKQRKPKTKYSTVQYIMSSFFFPPLLCVHYECTVSVTLFDSDII